MPDNPTPPQDTQSPPSAQEPLQYWHATGPAPLHPVLLGLCAITGAGVGIALTSVSAGVVASLAFEITRPSRTTVPAMVLAAIALLGVAFFIWHTRTKLQRERTIAIEHRSRGGRLFILGFLIGCGLACLAEGICFTVVALHP